ncbi:MAG: elongation factor P maturation arginine rhamnosyltransferase EarP [Burkholderiaceae bacterium]
MTATRNAIILCKVIDNFGDIGVCLRLALGLMDRGCAVTLVTDRPDLAERMASAAAVNLVSWDTVTANPHSVSLSEDMLVIEAFQVTPPSSFLQACPPKLHRVCLDYLATEAWAEGLQGMPAPDPAFPAHSRIWLAPSFCTSGPGLIRGRWEEIDTETRTAMRQRLVVYGADWVPLGDQGATGNSDPNSGAGVPAADRFDASRAFLVFAFGYDDAPWHTLAEVMQQEGLPEGFDRICFVKPLGLDFSLREFDAVLQSCDLNFVRGEDSFVRAHYAAAGRWQVPFVWQPYRQTAGAHLDKLAAWQRRLIHAEELRWASTPQVFSLPASSVDFPGDVWQCWLSLEAFFNPVPGALAPAVATTFSAAPWPLARPVCPASQEHSELPTPLLRSWQQLQQKWDLFRTSFSGACQRLIPGQSLETRLLQIFSSRGDF